MASQEIDMNDTHKNPEAAQSPVDAHPAIPGVEPVSQQAHENAGTSPQEPVEAVGAGRKTQGSEHRDARGQHGKRAEKHAPDRHGYRFADVVSGQLDQDEGNAEVAPPKRVLLPQAETPKLHKVLAQAGMGSRLEMEQLILEGRISVNNEPAHIGQRVQFGDQIKVNGKPIRFRIAPPPTRVIAYHKPAGEIVTHDDPQNRPTVFR